MKVLKLFVLLLIIISTFTGCLSKTELEDYAYVIAVGIDKGPNNNYIVSFQTAVPIKIAGEGSNGSGKEVTSLVTLETDTIYNSISRANAMISKEITLSHNKIIVFSEEVAKDGIQELLNAFVTNREVRPKTSMVVCTGSAKDFLASIEPVLEKNPSRYYDLLLDSNEYTGYTIDNTLFHFYLASQDTLSSPFALLTEPLKKQESSGDSQSLPSTANAAGIAIFTSDKLIGKISGEQMLSHVILLGKLKKVNIDIPDIKDSTKTTVIKVRQIEEPKFDVEIKNNIPKINIMIRLECDLITSGSQIDYTKKENKERLSDGIKEKLTKDMKLYLTKTSKEFKADPIGFGKHYRKKVLTLEELDNVKWQEIYPNSSFNIEFQIHLNTTQMVSNQISK